MLRFKEKFLLKFPCVNLEILDIYLSHIQNAEDIPKELYGEKHHILPKSLFPEVAKEIWNLKRISAQDHFIAHAWLSKLALSYGLQYAFSLMLTNSRRDQMDALTLELLASEYEKAKAERKVTEDHRIHISQALKGKCKSFEHLQNMVLFKKGHIISEETKRKMSESHFGIRPTESVKRKISLANKSKPSNAKGKVWVTKNIESYLVMDPQPYLSKGFSLGRISLKWINNGSKATRVPETELESYLHEGWVRGKLKNPL